MPMNRVQFQAGLLMFELLQHHGSEEKFEAAVEAARWPLGFACQPRKGRLRATFASIDSHTGSAWPAVPGACLIEAWCSRQSSTATILGPNCVTSLSGSPAIPTAASKSCCRTAGKGLPPDR